MLIRTLVLATITFLSASLASLSAATFNVAGDWLADESGDYGIPNGALIMLIASTKDDSFDVPTASRFLPAGSDDVILGAFTATDFDGLLNSGSFAHSVRANYGDAKKGLAEFDAGDPVLIRWFPTLSEEHLDSMPGGEVPYGEFRSDEILEGSDAPWVAPPDNGHTIALSIRADAFGNVSDPGGSIALSDLTALNLFLSVKLVLASLDMALGTDGLLHLSWTASADTVGNRLQESTDLRNWTDVPTDWVTVSDARATVKVFPAPDYWPTRYYRLAAD